MLWNATLDAALAEAGWARREGPGAYATFSLPEDRVAVLHVGLPADVANGTGLFASVVDTRVETEEESRALLAPALEPLARALGAQTVLYRGGGLHCGEV
jgi:hypothetical protein